MSPYLASDRERLELLARAEIAVVPVRDAADARALVHLLRPSAGGQGRDRGEEVAAGVDGGDALEGLVRAAERALQHIVALERERARLDAELLAAYGALHSVEEQQVRLMAASTRAAVGGRVSTARAVAEEVALATGVGAGEVARRLAVATTPRRHRLALGALRDGATSLHRVLQVASETAVLGDADVAVVHAAVLAPARDGGVVGQRTFTARLRRAVASLDQRGAEERRVRAHARRGVFGRMVEDGMGVLTLTADASTVAAVLDGLDVAARALRAAADPRTLDQLRCDLATQALLTGVPALASAPATPADAPAPTGDAAARVWLVVPFEVATGDSDAACELPGHGWVTAAHARQVMTRPGSVWSTLPVDVRTGAALSRPSRAYRPGRAVVEHVQAVDGVCRGPDCHVVADRCDVDHEVPWPAGETSVRNLSSKHRFHHNLKTRGLWTSSPVDGGGLRWTTPAGLTRTTWPKDWRAEPGPPPPLPHGPPPF